jgi:hypothetical protein
MKKSILAFDFSIAKPACCHYDGSNYSFYFWPKTLSKQQSIFKEAGVNVILRNNVEIVDITRYDIINADILGDLIIDTLTPFLNKETIIVFEGSSYGSFGNQSISLPSWRYILIYKLYKMFNSLDNLYTFSPITVKSTAGCAKRGMQKDDVIKAFINSGKDIPFRNYLEVNQPLFQKKSAKKTWIDGLDDLVDSYFILETYLKKSLK